jgi:hypothetical protein
MAKIIDPDNLGTGTTSAAADGHLYFNTTDLTIQLSAGTSGASTLDPYDGVTLQCVYSKCKEEWKIDTTLIKFPFPLISITGEQFELVNGWSWADDALSTKTINLIRDGGWRLYNAANTVNFEEYMNLTTLGTFHDANADQAYYTQENGGTPIDIVETGPVNQAIKIFGDAAHGAFDYRGFFNIYLREEAKSYDFYDLLTAQSLTTLTYKKYALPLSNGVDLKVTHSDATIAGTTPYTLIDIKYFDTNQTRRIGGIGYSFDKIIQCDTDCGSAGSITAAGTALTDIDMAMTIGYYDGGILKIHTGTDAGKSYNVSTNTATVINVTGDTFTAAESVNWTVSPASLLGAVTAQIYEKVQYSLRQTTDIDEGPGSVRGDTASAILSFVGDTLVTATGVFIDDFTSSDTNNIQFYDTGGTQRLFPYVAAGSINFNDNLQSDADAKYWMFFTSVPSGDFGTVNAVIVENADEVPVPITGLVSAQASVSFTFDYDGNVQGGRTPGTPAAVTVVAIGLSTGQYVKTTGTITQSTTNNFSLVAALERNYSNPA